MVLINGNNAQLVKHRYWMKRCLVLAQKSMNHTQPNPMVGSIVVDQHGKKIASGYHQAYGLAHAESNALKNFDVQRYPQASLYVNLEPCVHVGQTGPCAQLIVEKGIQTVVYGCQDPNPKVAGKGLAYLKKHGVNVIGPILEKQCQQFNRAFFYAVTHQRPWVTVKFAQSSNGYIGRSSQREKISGPQCEATTMKLRALSKMVMIGVNTLNVDNPKLNIRGKYAHVSTEIVVVDPYLRLNMNSQVLQQGEKLWVLHGEDQVDSDKKQTLANKAVRLMALPKNHLGQLNFNPFWLMAYTHGVHRILVEGGAYLIKSLDQQNAVHEYCVYKSQRIALKGDNLLAAPKIKALQHNPRFVIHTATDHIMWYNTRDSQN